MLQTIREKLTGWFAVFILGAIGLTLVVTFGNIDTGFTPGSVAASVNGEDLTVGEFRQIYQRQRQQWESTYRAQLPEMLATQMADSVIQSMVRNRVVAQHVRDEGYRINDDDVVAAITENQAFFVGGRFSQPAYEQLLGSQGLSIQRYEYEQRLSMQIQQFIEGIGYTAFFTPAEFRRYIELDGESRDLQYLILSAADKAGDVTIDAEVIAEFYASNQGRFQTEEAVSIAYVEVDFAAISESINVAEEDARRYYEDNPDEFRGPDERKASHILITIDEDESAAAAVADEVRARALSGEDFASLAAEYSADTGSAENGGDLGWLGADDSPAPEFETALFVLGEGEISPPVRTDFGFHIIKLEGVRAGKSLDYASVSADLQQRLRDDTAADVYGELLDELDERALESLDGLAPVAEAMSLELQTIDQFTRAGAEPLGFSPQLIDTVFSLEVMEDGENSPVIEIAEGRAVVVQVTDYRAPETRPLEAVSAEIEAQLRDDAAVELVASAGNELVGRLNSGEALDQDWIKREQVRRGEADLPADLAAAVFQAPKPELGGADFYNGLLLASGDFAIYRVLAVIPGKPEQYTVEDRDLRKQQLAGRLGGGHANAVVEALVEQAEVRITPDLVGGESDLL